MEKGLIFCIHCHPQQGGGRGVGGERRQDLQHKQGAGMEAGEQVRLERFNRKYNMVPEL